MTPTRETFGNISATSQTAFYVVAALSLGVFAYGVWRRVRLWRRGQPIGLRRLLTGGIAALRPGLGRLLVEGLGQQRVRGRGLASGAHLLLFVGFMVLFLGTVLLEIDHLAEMASRRLKFHRGTYYVVYEFTLDVLGLAFLAGVVLFAGRRLMRPSSVGHRASDWLVLGLFLAIGVTGYLVEGLRIAWQKPVGVGAACSPVGYWISAAFDAWTDSQARSAHLGAWWLHALLVFAFIAAIPFTRLFHILAGPLNLLLAQPKLGELRPVSLEEAEREGRIGISDVRHLTTQQLLSLDACMECGRCEEACPAFATGKPLSPKKIVQDLKSVMERLDRSASDAPLNPHDVIRPETLWSCTACSACVFVCPVRVDQLALILDMRRHLASEGGLSGTAATALRRMQSSANPWGLPPKERADWTQGLQSPETTNEPT